MITILIVFLSLLLIGSTLFMIMGAINSGYKYEIYDEYESREYCKASGCSIQYLIDNKENKDLKEDPKNYCKRECKAYRFHQYLKDNDYSIVKIKD